MGVKGLIVFNSFLLYQLLAFKDNQFQKIHIFFIRGQFPGMIFQVIFKSRHWILIVNDRDQGFFIFDELQRWRMFLLYVCIGDKLLWAVEGEAQSQAENQQEQSTYAYQGHPAVRGRFHSSKYSLWIRIAEQLRVIK